uniref:Uncharacterized protein n=1 Tax=Anguilla anguilla TaxID=7936 RepID=A0A0E9WC91_ANGAN
MLNPSSSVPQNIIELKLKQTHTFKITQRACFIMFKIFVYKVKSN